MEIMQYASASAVGSAHITRNVVSVLAWVGNKDLFEIVRNATVGLGIMPAMHSGWFSNPG